MPAELAAEAGSVPRPIPPWVSRSRLATHGLDAAGRRRARGPGWPAAGGMIADLGPRCECGRHLTDLVLARGWPPIAGVALIALVVGYVLLRWLR